MSQVPILVISDCPSQHSGLARITRDLCTLLAGMNEFRVATLGKYGMGSSRLPWTQYQQQSDEWGNVSLAPAWDEFSQDEPGIILTVWDVTRLLWLARPEYCEDEGLKEWLLDRRKRRFKLWGYVPVDATGPRNRLSAMSQECLMGFDRLLAYSPFGEEIIRNTIGSVEAEKRGLTWIPHGLNLRTFTPSGVLNKDTRVNTCTRDARGEEYGLAPASYPVKVASVGTRVPRVGVVATNQARKEWGLTAAICAALMERLRGEVAFWWHCDVAIRHFSLPALIADFQLGEHVELTTPPISDGEMSQRLRDCDLTLQVGAEGFGYGIFEALACGVPALHGDYAGGASIMRTCGLDDLLVEPVQWRLEGQHNCIRPVYDPQAWVDKVMSVLTKPPGPSAMVEAVEHLSWLRLGHVWKRWLREGLGNE